MRPSGTPCGDGARDGTRHGGGQHRGRTHIRALLAVVALGMHAAASAEPDGRGEALYREHGCAICHGEHGRTPARDTYPVIAGQRRGYLIRQILDIRSGVRDNGQADYMRRVIERLTVQEVEAIAGYLSELPCACGGDAGAVPPKP